MSWQPIETAPKDGTMVDLWVTDGGNPWREPDCYWHNGQWMAFDTWGYEQDYKPLDAVVLYWMEYPRP